jgi:hypothetical protein
MWVLVAETPPATSPLDVATALREAGVEPALWLEVEVQLEAMRTGTVDRPVTPRVLGVSVTRSCPPTVG